MWPFHKRPPSLALVPGDLCGPKVSWAPYLRARREDWGGLLDNLRRLVARRALVVPLPELYPRVPRCSRCRTGFEPYPPGSSAQLDLCRRCNGLVEKGREERVVIDFERRG